LATVAATKKKRVKPSGPSGANRQAQFPIREARPGQIEAWREAATADGRTLVGWIRWTLDNAVERWRKSKK
jgi:hypothetical protein